MFYYISFLRPPPAQASLTESILITPQICNDLRTEYFEGSIDIYYSWSLVQPAPASPVITRPIKLTSWRTANAYKGIPVPRPQSPTLRDGQSWRLVLSAGGTRLDQMVCLGEQALGRTPFPVMSMPVRFGSRPSQRGDKQEQIVRSYMLRLPSQETPVIFVILEQTSFDLDKKIWDSGIGLSSWLIQLFSGKLEESHLVAKLRQVLFGKERWNILELGAGTGIVAIALSILRTKLELSGEPGHIVTTDLPSAMPILHQNIDSNRHLTSNLSPIAAVLDWESEVLPPEIQCESELDVIVMADVTYNTSSFPALIATLSRLVRFSEGRRKGHSPMILMGYKERDSAERALWDMVKCIHIEFQRVGEVKGAGGNAIEIWVGQVSGEGSG
ncbi:putative methyltransferase-domain-containing protein [Phlebopus sp. FC_14]|nr:putative methyltransferase-domain-containing protein [Phlebopus sp. FC_14]